MYHPILQDNTYNGRFVIPVVEHWPEREIAQWVPPPPTLMKDRSDDPSRHERTLFTTELYILASQISSTTAKPKSYFVNIFQRLPSITSSAILFSSPPPPPPPPRPSVRDGSEQIALAADTSRSWVSREQHLP